VALGIVLRLREYLSLDSLWADEAMLAVNLRDRSWSAVLWGKLDEFSSTQAAPPGFLALTKGVIDHLGTTEAWVRLLPLLFSCLALVLFAVLSRRVLGPVWAVAPVAVFAVTRMAVQEAGNLKQYSLDMAAGTAMLLLLLRPASSLPRWWLGVSCGAAGLVWFSHPVVLVYCGAGLGVLGWMLWQREKLARLALLFAAAIPACVSFGALYVVSVRVQRDGYLSGFWRTGFAPWDSGLLAVGAWCVEAFREIHSLVGMNAGPLLFLWLLVVTPFLIKQHARDAAILLGIVVTAILFGLAHLYPVNNSRLGAYLIPVLCLVLTLGSKSMVNALGGSVRWRNLAVGCCVTVLAVTLVFTTSRAIVRFFSPRDRNESRELVAHLRSQLQASEQVHVPGVGHTAVLRWYWPEVAADPRFHLGSSSIADSAYPVWVVLRRSSLDKPTDRQFAFDPGRLDVSRSFVGRSDAAVWVRP
jgi:hypothetical protein